MTQAGHHAFALFDAARPALSRMTHSGLANSGLLAPPSVWVRVRGRPAVADTPSSVRHPTVVPCPRCRQLIDERDALVLHYETAATALEGTPKTPPRILGAGCWADLCIVAERIDEVQRLLFGHQKSHREA